MKLGLLAGYSPAEMKVPMDKVLEAERLGFDSVWTAEAYGSDAVTPAAWMLALTSKIKVGTAIMQMPARTPSCTAMTAMTLQSMSNGRFLIGLGPSGPQVAEGWYGQAYGKSVTRTKEYIAIIRQILERKDRLTFDGEYYQIPFTGEGSTGLGKPLKSILHGDPNTPIYTAAITPAGLRCAAEVADGVFPIWMDPEKYGLFKDDLDKGFGRSGNGKGLKDFDVAPFVTLVMGDDVEQCRMPVKHMMALYIGGMGAREKNFYNDYAKRLGFEEAAVKIQDLFLSGEKAAAADAVPDQLVDECALVGPADRIRDRLQAWKEAGKRGEVGSMLLSSNASNEALQLVAEEML